jgi:hypothetical protein
MLRLGELVLLLLGSAHRVEVYPGAEDREQDNADREFAERC